MTVWERCRRLRGFRELLEADAGSCSGVWDSSFLECSSYHSCSGGANTAGIRLCPTHPKGQSLLSLCHARAHFFSGTEGSFQSHEYSPNSWNNPAHCSMVVVDALRPSKLRQGNIPPLDVPPEHPALEYGCSHDVWDLQSCS